MILVWYVCILIYIYIIIIHWHIHRDLRVRKSATVSLEFASDTNLSYNGCFSGCSRYNPYNPYNPFRMSLNHLFPLPNFWLLTDHHLALLYGVLTKVTWHCVATTSSPFQQIPRALQLWPVGSLPPLLGPRNRPTDPGDPGDPGDPRAQKTTPGAWQQAAWRRPPNIWRF